jgi:hypothetical protein
VNADRETEHIVRSWLKEDEHADAQRVLFAVLGQLPVTQQRQSLWVRWRSPIMRNVILAGMAATVLVLVAIVAANLPATNGGISGPSASGIGTPSASPPGGAAINGLPPAGAALSDPTAGQLVLSYDGNVTYPATTFWLYSDGRLITTRTYPIPGGMKRPFVGLWEQRLTASGVQLLVDRALATGFFDDDLTLAREQAFLFMRVRNGLRLVEFNWEAARAVDPTTPLATGDQASALMALSDFLINPDGWPSDYWQDRSLQPYLPFSYGICVRGVPDPVDPMHIWAQLPEEALNVVTDGDPIQNGACRLISTDNARQLARMLDDAGFGRSGPDATHVWVRYSLRDPDNASEDLWFSFEPVLPDGEPTWLGPG